MTEIKLGEIIKAATFQGLNFRPYYVDGSDMYEMAGKIILFFEKEKAVESVTLPIINGSGVFRRKGNVIIHRDGSREIEWESRETESEE